MWAYIAFGVALLIVFAAIAAYHAWFLGFRQGYREGLLEQFPAEWRDSLNETNPNHYPPGV